MGGWPPPAAHRDFFAALPYSFACGDYLFVHAGLRPQRPITAQCPEDLLWIRRDFLDADDQWGKIVVFGHTPHARVLFTPGRIGLDTGCVYGGRLTCCEVRSRRLWQSDRCAP